MYDRITMAAAATIMILLTPILMVLAVVKTAFDVIVHGPKTLKEEQ